MSVYFIADVLDAETLASLRSRVGGSEFVDGRVTATGRAAEVKNNLQLDLATNVELAKVVVDGLLASAHFRGVAFPRRVRQPQFARYLEGMSYGRHLDTPIFSGADSIRADLSVTVFLSDDYEGGELIICSGDVEQHVKLPAGHAVVYSSDTLHSVAPVTSGERLVAVTWVQSLIRDPQLRVICSDLVKAGQILDGLSLDDPTMEAQYLLAKSKDNLLRKFTEF